MVNNSDSRSLEVISYLRNISILLIAVLFLLFPVFFLTGTNDIFIFPKQLLLTLSASFLLILFFLRTIFEGKIRIRFTPLNLPIALFAIILLVSSLLSQNVYDSLMQSVPLVAVLILFFVLINNIEDRLALVFATLSLVFGGIFLSVVTIFSFFNVYILPFAQTQSRFFSPFGSPLQQLVYLAALLLISVLNLIPLAKARKISYESIIFAVSALLSGFALTINLYQIFFSSQKIITLPFLYGFQIALSTISQDAGRVFTSFLFGSGYGTFGADFTRFKSLGFNQAGDFWSLVFNFSSNYFLEVLTTVGFLGVFAFLFLIFKTLQMKSSKVNPLYIAALFLFVFSFFVPYSFPLLFLLFMILGLYAADLYVQNSSFVYNVVVSMVALREGLIGFETESKKNRAALQDESSRAQASNSRLFPIAFFLVALVVCGFVFYYSLLSLISDIKIRESLVQAGSNNAQKAYNLQAEAIRRFPYKSDYYRLFSQLNIALANSVAANIPKDSSPSADTQNTILTLVQQSIGNARSAVTVSPVVATNWQNLSQIYRGLINVGQNSDQFAIASIQRAIALDPYNPFYYIELGGIYYQLGQYDAAQQQFQVAVSLKADLPNAYYNLGHALEAKGDLQNAINQYEIVKNLTGDNKENLDKISKEIDDLKNKLGAKKDQEEKPKTAVQETKTPASSQPLKVSTPETKLPAQRPPVNIPPPPTATASAK